MYCINCGKKLKEGKLCTCINRKPDTPFATMDVTSPGYDVSDGNANAPSPEASSDYYGQGAYCDETPSFNNSQYVYADLPTDSQKEETKKKKSKPSALIVTITIILLTLISLIIIGATVGSKSESNYTSNVEKIDENEYSSIPDSDYSIGEYNSQNNTYTNDWAGLDITVPEGYEEYETLYTPDFQEKYTYSDLCFAARKDDNQLIMIDTGSEDRYTTYEFKTVFYVAKSNIVSKRLEKLGITAEYDYEQHDITLDGRKYLSEYATCTDKYGNKFYMLVAVHRDGTGFHSICITDTTKQNINSTLKNMGLTE